MLFPCAGLAPNRHWLVCFTSTHKPMRLRDGIDRSAGRYAMRVQIYESDY